MTRLRYVMFHWLRGGDGRHPLRNFTVIIPNFTAAQDLGARGLTQPSHGVRLGQSGSIGTGVAVARTIPNFTVA